MTRLRVEVEDQHGSTVLYVNEVLDELPDDVRAQLLVELNLLLEGLGSPDALDGLLAVLAQQTADVRAYERAATRRGHLPL